MKIIKGLQSTSQDDYQLNIITLIKHAARNFATQKIIERKPDGRIISHTYKEEYERIKKLGSLLHRLGVRPGDRIGVLDWNDRRHYELYYGIPGSGAVLLQMNVRLLPQELIYIANHSETKLIFADETLLPIVEAISSELKYIKGYVVMSDKKIQKIGTKLDPIYNYEDVLDEASPEFDFPMIDEKSTYAACYTSGTTGKPKGVYYSHRCIYLHSLQVAISYEFSNRDCLLLLTPMFHANGWGLPQVATLVGANFILPGRFSVEDLKVIVDLIKDENVSVAFGATAIFMAMLEYIKSRQEKINFSGVRLFSGGSEPPPAMIKGFFDLTGAEVSQAWGATETTPLVTTGNIRPWIGKMLSQEARLKLKSTHGYPMTGIDMKIIDEKGGELPHDGKAVGEILARGPWITKTYYNSPEGDDKFTEDGYWRSGDVGMIDGEGQLKMVDRIKDLIKSGGEWISSLDMENDIMRHPEVLEAAVIGVPHPKWEERPVAIVVLKNESKGRIKDKDILDYLGRTFSKWQLPDKIEFVDEIPKTSVGKFNKRILKEKYKNVFR